MFIGTVSCMLQIYHKDFNFRAYGRDTLQKMESIGSFPPRFVVSYEKIIPNALKLSSKIIVSTGTKSMTFHMSSPLQGIQLLQNSISCTLST